MSINVSLPAIPGFTPAHTFRPMQLMLDPEYPQTSELVLAVVSDYGYLLEFAMIHTPAIELAAVKDYGKALQWCNNFSQELCDAAVDRDARAIKYVPDIYQTEALCLKAVTSDGMLLRYCKRQSPAVVTAALQENPDSLIYVKQQTPDMVKLLLAQTTDTASVMADVHYSMLARQPRPQKVFTQSQLTDMVLSLDCASTVKNELLKQLLL